MTLMSEMEYKQNSASAIKSAINELFESEAVVARLTEDLNVEAKKESEYFEERFAERAKLMDNEVTIMLRQLMVVSSLCREIVAWVEARTLKG